jgi:hypothetical protein
MTTCKAGSCEKVNYSLGYCQMHYRRFKKTGSPYSVKLIKGDDTARFHASYTVRANGCWIWDKTLTSAGYGRFTIGYQSYGAHRWSYQTFVGPISDGLVIDHLCRTPTCVNPAHLEPVTVAENNLRGETVLSTINKHKTHCIRGHEFTPGNTYLQTSKYGVRRICRECKRILGRRQYHKTT